MLSSHSVTNNGVTRFIPIKKTRVVVHAEEETAKISSRKMGSVPTTTAIMTPPIEIAKLTKNQRQAAEKNFSAGLDLMGDEGGLAGGEDGGEEGDVGSVFYCSVDATNYTYQSTGIIRIVVPCNQLLKLPVHSTSISPPTTTIEDTIKVLANFLGHNCGIIRRNGFKMCIKSRSYLLYK
ncbi:uncharacterized protein BcabD6B2_17470 [Babesia caballi]|uniref:Uncharacterized protein n=1 Tax=Babesia caballi TaxID=5871 RepID=A0AAV4LRA0_BABCB|nr:hypothetical protein, conserved [Babesia caballi]